MRLDKLEWTRKMLGEILVANYGKSLPKTKRIAGNINVYGSGGIVGSHNEYLVKGPGIIIGRKGTVGSINYVKDNYYPIDTVYYIQEGLDYDLKFLFYKLKTIGLDKMNTHSAVPGLNREHMYSKEVLMPKINEQKAIAKILSDLDEKIEVNNKINKNLEEMAQAIFKQWFVDFEFPNEEGKPYKSSGGEMVESELGMIPKTFSISTLGNEVKTIDNRGKTPPLEKEKTEYPIIDVKVLAGSSRIINYNNCLKFVNEETYKNWFRSGHPLEKDILISTVGSLAELKMFFGHKGCIAQNVVALRSINISSFYMYEYLKYIKPKLVSYNIGSVQPSIKITHIMKHNIIIPEKNIVLKYDNLINSIIEKIYNNENENERLEKLRDTLLPKLMSGEIRVPLENSEN
ncbi:restriction endonuclease subunit S [Clostridium perfringens]|uniref:restriction endonuclease subunit S n=1 Tax=Clostridium perfringens TaxID=1502 RepID=UPI002AC72000|nr:restriction endonuclease subunit S [Clostridium perfringens]MDZ5041104.1 restriction endonuclease subunit S [Clostridium perfringens]